MTMPVNCSLPCQAPQQLPLPLNAVGVWGVDCNGTFTFVPNGTLTVPDPNTVQLVRICPGGSANEFDVFTMCTDLGGVIGQPVIVVVSYGTTGIPTVTLYTIAGLPFPGTVADLYPCANSTQLESDAEQMCDDAGTFIRWYVKQNGVPTGATFDTDLTGAPYISSGPVNFGPCTGANPVGANTYLFQVDSAIPLSTPLAANPYSGVTIRNRSATVTMRAQIGFAVGFTFAPGDEFIMIPPGDSVSANFRSECIQRIEIAPFDNSPAPGTVTPASAIVPTLAGGVHSVFVHLVNG